MCARSGRRWMNQVECRQFNGSDVACGRQRFDMESARMRRRLALALLILALRGCPGGRPARDGMAAAAPAANPRSSRWRPCGGIASQDSWVPSSTSASSTIRCLDPTPVVVFDVGARTPAVSGAGRARRNTGEAARGALLPPGSRRCRASALPDGRLLRQTAIR